MYIWPAVGGNMVRLCLKAAIIVRAVDGSTQVGLVLFSVMVSIGRGCLRMRKQ